jgi:hypothetical protein
MMTAQAQAQAHACAQGATPALQTHLLRCSIRACFSRSSLSAATRPSSSRFAGIAVWCSAARAGRMFLKEGAFLLKLQNVLN